MKNVSYVGKLFYFADFRNNSRGAKPNIKLTFVSEIDRIQVTIWDEAGWENFLNLTPIFMEQFRLDHVNVERITEPFQTEKYNNGTTIYQLKWTKLMKITKTSPMTEDDLKPIPISEFNKHERHLITTNGTLLTVEDDQGDPNKPFVWHVQQGSELIRISFWGAEKEKTKMFAINQRILLIGVKVLPAYQANAKPTLSVQCCTIIMEC